MAERTAVVNLRNKLANLYPDQKSTQRIAFDAGIDTRRIEFSNHAINNWQAILVEAEKVNRVEQIVNVALGEYGENSELQRVWEAFQPSQETKPVERAPIRPVVSQENPVNIFLSYSHQDTDIMQRLYADLAAAGLGVWIDEGLEPGTPSWQRAIRKALEEAQCLVVILSPDAEQSEWVETEISWAKEIGLRLFPVLARGDVTSAVPFSLINVQRVDIRTEYQNVETSLIPALRRHLGVVEPAEPDSRSAEAVEQQPEPTAVAEEQPEVVEPKKETEPQPLEEKKPTDNETSQEEARPAEQSTMPATPKVEPQKTGQLRIERQSVSSTPKKGRGKTGYRWQWGLGAVALLVIVVVAIAVFTGGIFDDATPTFPIRTPLPTFTPTRDPVASTWTNPKDDAIYVKIPAGVFTMGDGDEEHTVDVPEFWIMQTEVTNEQYQNCVIIGLCRPPNNDRWNDDTYAKHPVAHVDWNQAKTYAEWTGGRLPTEAEWEKACRGSDGEIYPWGNQAPSAERLNYTDSGLNDTAPVRSYPAGANGLYDMAGNVWEWTGSQHFFGENIR